jgi:hydrogenase maturation protease
MSLSAEPSRLPPGRVLLLGVGNDWRGDDGAGPAVARRLRELNLPGLTVRETAGDAATLLASFKDAATVILVDAASSGAEPGTVWRLQAGVDAVPLRKDRGSTHGLGVAEAVELARVLKELPPRLIIFGIEGKSFGPGPGLSPEVVQAVDEVAGRILREFLTASAHS